MKSKYGPLCKWCVASLATRSVEFHFSNMTSEHTMLCAECEALALAALEGSSDLMESEEL